MRICNKFTRLLGTCRTSIYKRLWIAVEIAITSAILVNIVQVSIVIKNFTISSYKYITLSDSTKASDNPLYNVTIKIPQPHREKNRSMLSINILNNKLSSESLQNQLRRELDSFLGASTVIRKKEGKRKGAVGDR